VHTARPSPYAVLRSEEPGHVLPTVIVSDRLAGVVRDTRRHALDIMALAVVCALPGVVVLAVVGANAYWISLVMMRHLLGSSERPPRRHKQHCCTCRPTLGRHDIRAGRRGGSTVRNGFRVIRVLAGTEC
jgi:hypothetical protein